MSVNVDPVTLEIFRHLFASAAEEMGVTLRRTAYSPNIKERLDFSCAAFDGAGRLLAQADHIPAHLGAMPGSVEAVLARFDSWSDGDIVILNDPYAGGNHLPDITMVSPVFIVEAGSQPAFFVASRAHHADVGGMSPGSMPLSVELIQEGIIIPPVKLYEAGRLNAPLLDMVCRNVRTPDERRGDLNAQMAAHRIGARRLQEIVSRYGFAQAQAYGAALIAYAERITRQTIAAIPDGTYAFADYLDDPNGTGAPVKIAVTITVHGDGMTVDFAGTAPEMYGSLNAVPQIAHSAVRYCVRSLIEEDVPTNHGTFAPVKIICPFGSVLNPHYGRAVAGGNVETSQRIVDTVLGALAQALPDRVPAASQGSMNNLTMGGDDPFRNKPYAYYETMGGGMGAAAQGNGLSGVHVHMSNTLNTPIEALEMAFPFRLTRYALRKDSSGDGRHRGGEGLVREVEFLAPATVTMLSERRRLAPYGAQGGQPGGIGRNTLRHADGTTEDLGGKFSRRLDAGDVLTIETPGGGGYGAPLT
ncbi:MAG: hydantoinase B/oxoprolinase family protein [Chloroflexi bacterium]|nr:hydantoinase B/oxoprolinase family protein [Chloroflexota bacterium]